MGPVFGGGEDVAEWLQAISGLGGRLLDRLVIEAFADEGLLDSYGCHRFAADAVQADAGLLADAVAVHRHDSGGTDDCIPRRRVGEFFIGAAGTRGERRYAEFGEDFVGLQRGGQDVYEELSGADGALPLRPYHLDRKS